MKVKHPILSVIIASQTIGSELYATLDSFLIYGNREIEIIVQGIDPSDIAIDGLLYRYSAFKELLYIGTERDTGIYDAFNKALKLCHGEWVVFVGAGDRCLSPQILESVLTALQQTPNSYEFCAFPILLIFPSLKPIETIFPSQTPVKDLPDRMCLPHPGLFHRRRLFLQYSFCTAYRIAGDYEFVCRTVTDRNVCYGEFPWLGMVVGGVSSSLLTLPASDEEFLEIAKQYFPNAFLLKARLRLLKSSSLFRLAHLIGKKRVEFFADFCRFLRGKAPLWSSISREAVPLPPLPKKPRIDLVVATLGRIEPLELFLETVSAQSYKNFHIIIADQNPEGFLDAVLAVHADLPITHVRLPFRGVSKARNAALVFCKGDIVGFPDDDCWYAPETLDEVQAIFGERDDVGILTGNLVYVEKLGVTAVQAETPRRYSTMSMLDVFRHGGTAAFFVRRDLVEQVGGFDTSLGPREEAPYACGEDIDYYLRIYKTGYTALRSHRSMIFHLRPINASGYPLQKIVAYGKGRMELCSRHNLPWWFRLLNVLYPLIMLPVDFLHYGKAGATYRGIMFWVRLKAVLKKI